jgi:signal transduction histidine kinase
MVNRDLHDAVILLVDDEQANVDLLAGCLADEGYTNVKGLTDPRQVMPTLDELRPDLILLDLHMPWVDGFAILEQLSARIPPEEYLPVLVLTADVTELTKQRALSGGAKDFLTKPLDLTEVALRIRNLLQTRYLHEEERRGRKEAEEAGLRTATLAAASQILTSSFDYHTTLAALCSTLVPAIADYCVVDVLTKDGKIDRVGLTHKDPSLEPLVRAALFADAGRLPPDHPLLTALLQGRRTLAKEVTPDMIKLVTADEEHQRAVEQVGPRSIVAVPIQANREIHGSLMIAYTEDRRYDLPDLDLAIEIARRAALTIENARLFDQAQQATRARDELLAVVAHDLRNPLSTVKMGATMLLEEATTDLQRRSAELVGRAADRMHRLIEDLLDATRIQSGKLSIEPVPHSASAIIAEAVAMLTPLAGSRNVVLSAEINRNQPLVMLDPTRILQVLSNLLGNAIKFTPEGGRVRVGCEVVGEELKLSVTDTGPGIPPDQISHIFGRLWQAHAGDRRGIGLGLSIVQGIVEAHGGRVWVESEVGSGTTFHFTLPLARVEADLPTEAAATG